MRFHGYCGGSPLNTAVALARLGVSTGYVTQLSTDLFGERLRRHLETNGVDTRFVLSHPAPSTLAFVERHDEANEYVFLANGSADSLYSPNPLPDLPAETRFLHFGSVSLLSEPAATSFTRLVERHADRMAIVFDPNVRPSLIPDAAEYRRRCAGWIRTSHLLKLSEEDATYLAGGGDVENTIAAWLADGPTVVVVTQGPRGARLYRGGEQPLHSSAFAVTVADSIGAGDTFTAGIIAALLDRDVVEADGLAELPNAEWRGVLRFAAAAAAVNCTRPGADPPTRAELTRLLEAPESLSTSD